MAEGGPYIYIYIHIYFFLGGGATCDSELSLASSPCLDYHKENENVGVRRQSGASHDSFPQHRYHVFYFELIGEVLANTG